MLKVAGVFICLFILLCSTAYAAPKEKFDLIKSYNAYKDSYLSTDGRIIDGKKNDITTSEGQSYMMLRAVLVGDKRTFDRVYKWSDSNLKREDNLYSWLWGKNDKTDKWEVLDEESATDADVYIAYSLILASEKWNSAYYKAAAIDILNTIWEKETKIINNRRILMPWTLNELFNNEFNPSYFVTHMFKRFAQVDSTHDWNSVIDSSYYYLDKNVELTKTGLPSNWFYINGDNVELENSNHGDFSYDAARIFLNLYADYKYTKDERALNLLKKLTFFADKWKKSPDYYTNYQANGELRDENYFYGALAIICAALSKQSPKVSHNIYNDKITPFINNAGVYEKAPNKNYYSNNLLWFAMYYSQH